MRRCLPAIFFFALCATVHAQLLAPIVNFGKPRGSGGTGNSLIFTSSSTQYLSNAGNASASAQKFTLALWYKRASTGSTQALWGVQNSGSTTFIEVYFDFTNHLNIAAEASSTQQISLTTNATFTDTSAWHHLDVAVDTTQSTSSNRVLVYSDGTVISSYSSSTYPSLNANLATYLSTDSLVFGNIPHNSDYFNGKMALVYYIDGQQLTPSSFITGTPGAPKTYSGTYTGTFDFFLPFSNGTSTTTLGADSSGESNNWTLNNMTTANQSSDHP